MRDGNSSPSQKSKRYLPRILAKSMAKNELISYAFAGAGQKLAVAMASLSGIILATSSLLRITAVPVDHQAGFAAAASGPQSACGFYRLRMS